MDFKRPLPGKIEALHCDRVRAGFHDRTSSFFVFHSGKVGNSFPHPFALVPPHVVTPPGDRSSIPVGTIHGEGTRAGKRAGNGVNAGKIVKLLFGNNTDPFDGLHGPGISVPFDMH